jgi:PAS domain S-box-containing protein
VTGHNLIQDPHIQGVVVNYRDITARKLAEAALKESEERYRTIFQSAGVALWEDDYTALFDAIAGLKAEGVTDFRTYLADHPEFLTRAAEAIRVLDVNDAAVKMMGAADKSELLGPLARIFKGPPSQSFIDEIVAFAEGKKQFESEVSTHNLSGERREQLITITLPEHAGFDRVLVSALDITERKRMEAALQESQSRLEAIINNAINAIITIDENQQIVLFNPAAEKVFDFPASQVMGEQLSILMPERFRDTHDFHVFSFGNTGVSNRDHGMLDSLYGLRSNGEEFPMEAYISQSVVNDKKYFTVILQDITERRRAEDAVRQRAAELESLVAVSTSLRAASTVAEMIPVVIREAANVTRAANGTIFLLEPSSGDLVSRGWYSAESDSFIQLSDEQVVRHTIYEGITGYVTRTGQVYSTDHMHEDPLPVFVLGEAERLVGMNSGISLPLRAHDSIVGVLHVAMREKRTFTDTEVRLLTAIAEMAGNALQRASLLEKTLHQAEELAAAYDNTLAGWARALELRDELTEGHTRRVTALTIQLSHAMGISPEDLVQIQRGAILHDIGKMGIPDQILLKRGPLTLEESVVMRRHPQFAYEMLYPIAFLRPALEIPYCHHEKWDGTGYPRGIKGDEIPLAARIFAVADVWDAITSDRPYRPAWSREKAIDYMRSESGKYFDPRVLKIFLSLDTK